MRLWGMTSERGEWKSWLKTQHSKNEDQGIWFHHFMASRLGNNGNSGRLFFLGSKPLQMVTAAMRLKDAPWKKSFDEPRQHSKKQRHYFVDKGPSSQSYGFSSSHVSVWGLDYKESWVLKNWCFWTVVLEKTLERPLDCKEIQLVHPKGNQSWIFIGRTDAEAEASILWPPDAKNWLIRTDPDAGKDWRQEEKGGQRVRLLDGITDLIDMKFEQALRGGDGPGSQVCCSPGSGEESDTTEWLNWTEGFRLLCSIFLFRHYLTFLQKPI